MDKFILSIIISAIFFLPYEVISSEELIESVNEAVQKSKQTRKDIQNSNYPRDPASVKNWKSSKEMLTEFNDLLNSNDDKDWLDEVDKLTKE